MTQIVLVFLNLNHDLDFVDVLRVWTASFERQTHLDVVDCNHHKLQPTFADCKTHIEQARVEILWYAQLQHISPEHHKLYLWIGV